VGLDPLASDENPVQPAVEAFDDEGVRSCHDSGVSKQPFMQSNSNIARIHASLI